MKKLLSRSLIIGLLCLAGTHQLEAQGMKNPGVGGFLDWIHRLSGPRMLGGSISVFSPTWNRSDETPILRGRLTGAYRHSFSSDDKIDPDGSAVTMFSIQPMVEFYLFEIGQDNHIDIAIGAAFNKFGGDSDPFWHTSFPAYLQGGVHLTDSVFLKIGVGAHYWPKFDASDFDPLVVDVERTEGEFTPAAFVGLDFPIF